MKIVYISDSIIPSRTANSIQVMKMCNAFAKNGHSVVLFCPYCPGLNEKNVKEVYDFYGVEKSFKIIKIPSWNYKIFSHIYGMLCVLIILLINPDLVYGRGLSGLVWAAFVGKRVIYEIHKPNEIEGRKAKYLMKSPKLQYIVTISNRLKEAVLLKIRNNKVIVAHDASDINENICGEYMQKQLLYKNTTVNIGYTGHLYPGKGGEIIVKLAEIMPNICFHVYGGFKKDILKFNKVGLKNVIFHGFINPGNVPAVLNKLDILLLPALDKVFIDGSNPRAPNISKYMSPLKMFEYMASGRPIISSDLPVLREILSNKSNCLLVPHDDISKWQEAIEYLLMNPKFAEELGRTAKETLEKKHTWDKRARAVLSCLECR